MKDFDNARTLWNKKGYTMEVDVTTFEVWEFWEWPTTPRWIILETFETLDEALDYIDEGGWEYEPFLEIREIETVEYFDECMKPL